MVKHEEHIDNSETQHLRKASFSLGNWLRSLVEKDKEKPISETAQLYHLARRSKDFDEALSAYNRLVEIDPKTYLLERKSFFLENHRLEEALMDCNRAVELDPENGLLDRACFHFHFGSKEIAFEDFEAVIKLRKAELLDTGSSIGSMAARCLAEALYERALCYAESHEIELAAKDYEEASEFDLSFSEICADFCEDHTLWKHYQNCLDRMVQAAPRYLTRRADFFERQVDYESASNDYNNAVKLAPMFSEKKGYSPKAWALMCRAGFFRRHGRTNLAKKDETAARFLSAVQSVRYGFNRWPDR